MNLTEREFSDTLSILTDFQENCRVICAFSGGCDSLGLLILLVKTLGTENVVPVYINHNLRSLEELESEVEKNKLNCDRFGLQLIVETVDRGEIAASSKEYGGIEASARHFRYSLLEKQRVMNNCSFIATAHHFDDQLETVLMRIINRAPVSSMRGISETKGYIIRPLLEFRRKDIENYVSKSGFSWSIDSTNKDNSFKRNELRNVIIPQLKTVLPDWENRVENIRKKAVEMCIGSFKFHDKIGTQYIAGLNKAQQTLALFSMWDSVVGSQMPQTLADRVLKSLNRKFAVISSNGGTFCIHKDELYLVKNEAVNEKSSNFQYFKTPLVINGITYLSDGSCIEAEKGGNGKSIKLNPASFSGIPFVRYAQPGDNIRLKDGTKKVMRLLQDLKVPPVMRNKVPVIVDSVEVCAVFASAFGTNDRICSKMRCSLAQDGLYSYIYKKR